MTPEALVRSGTSWAAVPFVPEIRLLTAAEPFGLWDLTERDAPPFWAFPWAGGQALARYVLDHPEIVRGRRVLDAASGSGLVAIAAAKAGAASVTACDVDPNAVAAIGINARANDAATVAARVLDLAADDPSGAQVVLTADVFYQRELAGLALRFLRRAAASGADVLVADPGRAFLPASALTSLASYEVPVLTVLEDKPVKNGHRVPAGLTLNSPSVLALLLPVLPQIQGLKVMGRWSTRPEPTQRSPSTTTRSTCCQTTGAPGGSPARPGAGARLVRLRLLDAAAQRRGQHLADRLDQPAHLVGEPGRYRIPARRGRTGLTRR